MDQLTGGVRVFVPSESLLLPWPEPAATTPAGVASFMKALSWYYARLHHVHAPGEILDLGQQGHCRPMLVMATEAPWRRCCPAGQEARKMEDVGWCGGVAVVVRWWR